MRGEFRWEADLVEALLLLMREGGTPWSARRTLREFEYTGGRADVLALSDVDVVAFEAKLSRWRVALHQAYRNTAFAHRSFVVLPSAAASRAVAFRGEFERRGVGLCAVRAGAVDVLIEPRERVPLLPSLTTRALSQVAEGAAA